jgi:hypothetical protein
MVVVMPAVVGRAIDISVAITAIVRTIRAVAASVRNVSIVAIIRTVIGTAVTAVAISTAIVGTITRPNPHPYADIRPRVGSSSTHRECKSRRGHKGQEYAFHDLPLSMRMNPLPAIAGFYE